MGTLDYLSDNLIELRGPVDIANDAAIDAATVSAKLYDTALDTTVGAYTTVLTADALSAAGTIFVQDRTPFAVLDAIGVQRDDGTEQVVVVSVLPGSAGEITIVPVLTEASAKGSTVKMIALGPNADFITLADWSEWQNFYTMEITRGSASVTVSTVEQVLSLINRDAGYAVIVPGALGDTAVGNPIKRKIGADITMTAFGSFPTSNPVVGDPTWGYRGTIDHDHSEIALGMRIRGEITLTKGTLNLSRKAIATVIKL